VALLDLDAASVVAAAAEVGAVGSAVADVRDPRSVRAGVAAAAEALGGPPTVLVNAAGIYRVRPAAEIEPEEWDDVLDTNLRGTFLVTREVVGRLWGSPGAETGRSAEGGAAGAVVVNMASTAALVADSDEPAAHYNASKAGVVALTKQMAAEWGPRGVRVNAVAPGVIDTPMLRLMDDRAAGREYLETRVPLRRLGRAEEVAEVIVFLASDLAAYVTGATVVVDGGATAL
jgi:NAD(P)-dependent dehydrogenase (short-subunit alcohol dehydrogenase family)